MGDDTLSSSDGEQAGQRSLRRRPGVAAVAGRLGLTWQLGLTLLVAGTGLALARSFHLPGGIVIGAMATTAIASLLNAPLAAPPPWMRRAARILLGLAIGAAVTMETLTSLASALLPVTAIILAMIAAGLAVAWVINRFTRMSLTTALCGCTPGVLPAMVALAEDLGGDGPVVASLHLVRLISVLLFVPALAQAFFHQSAPVLLAAPQVAAPQVAAPQVAGAAGLTQLGLLLAIGLVVGFLAARTNLPAADLLAGLVAAAVLNALWLHLSAVPGAWRTVAQWIVGAGLGTAVTRQTLRTFRPFAVAGALMTAFLLATGLALAWLLWQMTTLDPMTCLVATAAGGAETMIILAGELGGDAQLVAAVHVARQIILLLVVPLLVRGATRGRAGSILVGAQALPTPGARGEPTP